MQGSGDNYSFEEIIAYWFIAVFLALLAYSIKEDNRRVSYSLLLVAVTGVILHPFFGPYLDEQPAKSLTPQEQMINKLFFANSSEHYSQLQEVLKQECGFDNFPMMLPAGVDFVIRQHPNHSYGVMVPTSCMGNNETHCLHDKEVYEKYIAANVNNNNERKMNIKRNTAALAKYSVRYLNQAISIFYENNHLMREQFAIELQRLSPQLYLFSYLLKSLEDVGDSVAHALLYAFLNYPPQEWAKFQLVQVNLDETGASHFVFLSTATKKLSLRKGKTTQDLTQNLTARLFSKQTVELDSTAGIPIKVEDLKLPNFELWKMLPKKIISAMYELSGANLTIFCSASRYRSEVRGSLTNSISGLVSNFANK